MTERLMKGRKKGSELFCIIMYHQLRIHHEYKER
ncbi:Uncharacterised protein [Legionella jordanis]|nr:Uncharacterised protein [Legionella jordanis]